MRSLLATILLVACGDDGAKQPDAAVVDIDAPVVDAYVPAWSTPTTISDPANGSFLPSIAIRGTTTVITWHDFVGTTGVSRVVLRAITNGTMGPITPVSDTLMNPKRPTVVATANGFVLVYDAIEGSTSRVRVVDLDAAGVQVGSPTTISGAMSAQNPRVAAHGDDVIFAWIENSAHYFARRGPVETVSATPVGTTLQSPTLLNYPRVAITSTGVQLLAYRDGALPADQEVLLMIRQPLGMFQGPLNVSRSQDLLSDDISLAMEPNDTLDIVWVDQDPNNVNAFEVLHATRTAGGTITAPIAFSPQGLWAWTPSAVTGMTAAWQTGTGAAGDLWLAENGPAAKILAPEQGGMPALAKADDGTLHFAYVAAGTPRQLRYAVRR